MREVTDPDILRALNSPEEKEGVRSKNSSERKEVTDPEILKALNADNDESGTGINGIREDVLNSFLSAPEAALTGIENIPEHAEKGYEYASTHTPLQSLGQNLIGAGEGVASTFNAPYNLAQYLKSKNVPWFKQTANYVPHIPIDYLEGKLGIQPNETGAQEMRALGQLPLIARGLKGIPGKSGKALAFSAMGGDPIHNMMLSQLLNTKLPQQRSWQEALKEYLI